MNGGTGENLIQDKPKGGSSATVKREPFWDMAKAILIFLVTWGHCVQFFGRSGSSPTGASLFWFDPVFIAIYGFHMPMFMFISGYFHWEKMRCCTRKYALKLLKHLLAPCVAFFLLLNVCHWFICIIKADHMPKIPIWNAMFGLWFLWTILEGCFFAWIVQLSKSLWWVVPAAIFPIAVALIWSSCLPCAGMFTFMWPFFLTGGLLKKHVIPLCRKHWLGIPAIVTYVVLCIFFDKSWYVYITPLSCHIDSIPPYFFRMLCGFCGIIACLYLFLLLPARISTFPFVACIGRCTLAVYVLQAFFFSNITIFSKHLGAMHFNNFLLFWMALLLLFVFCMVYSMLRRVRLLRLLLFGGS